MSRTLSRVDQADFSKIIDVLSNFQSGNFFTILSPSDDPNLNYLIEKVNETTKYLRTQAVEKEFQNLNSDMSQVFMNSPDLICVLNVDSTFAFANPSFKTNLEFTDTDLISKTFIEFVHPEDIVAATTMSSLSKKNPTIDFEIRFRGKSGEYRRIKWAFTFLEGRNSLYAIGQDLTELDNAEHRAKQILTAVNQTTLVAFTNSKGIIEDVNEHYCALSEYSREELIGEDHRILNSGRHSKAFFKEMWQTINAGKTWTSTIENRKKSGQPYFALTTISPIKNSTGEIERFISIQFDVTELTQAEQRLKEAQRISKIGSWHFNLRSGLQTWSEEHYKIFEIEFPQSQADLFRLYRERIHQDDLPGLDVVIDRALKYGEDFVYNHRVSLDGGQRIKYVQGIGKVSMDHLGRPEFISGTCQDVTESRAQQERLKTTIELNEAIRRSAKLSIVTTDLNGLITSFNDEAERMLGYVANDLIGKATPAAFHDPVEVKAAAEILSKELNTQVEIGFDTFICKAKLGGFDERDWTYISKDGLRIPIRLNVTGLYNANNELYGYMGIAQDLSEQVLLKNKLEAERVRSIRNAKLASMGEMSAGIAHEINNPLAIISGSIGLLTKFLNDPQKLNQKIESIKKSCDRIARIVNGLRKFSRSGDRSDFQNNDLSNLVKEALILTETKSKREATTVTMECEPTFNVICDEIEIEQVLVNLINNSIDAIKHLPEKWVKVSTYNEGHSVVLRVMDSGPGIPDHVRSKLFDPFFTTKKVGEGTGLGLSIAKGILDEHKATITIVDGLPNTCFEIKFFNVETSKSAS